MTGVGELVEIMPPVFHKAGGGWGHQPYGLEDPSGPTNKIQETFPHVFRIGPHEFLQASARPAHPAPANDRLAVQSVFRLVCLQGSGS